jgi:hypothetical protein
MDRRLAPGRRRRRRGGVAQKHGPKPSRPSLRSPRIAPARLPAPAHHAARTMQPRSRSPNSTTAEITPDNHTSCIIQARALAGKPPCRRSLARRYEGTSQRQVGSCDRP